MPERKRSELEKLAMDVFNSRVSLAREFDITEWLATREDLITAEHALADYVLGNAISHPERLREATSEVFDVIRNRRAAEMTDPECRALLMRLQEMVGF